MTARRGPPPPRRQGPPWRAVRAAAASWCAGRGVPRTPIGVGPRTCRGTGALKKGPCCRVGSGGVMVVEEQASLLRRLLYCSQFSTATSRLDVKHQVLIIVHVPCYL